MPSTFVTSLVLAAVLMGQKPDSVDRGTDNDKAAAEERLKFMKESVETYRLTLNDDRETPLRLEGKPAFRLGKQSADNVVDGAIFFWIGVGGRPETAVQAFMIKDSYYPQGLWIHEFTSLAPGPLTAERGKRSVWAPTTGGVEFKPIPGAPKPAATLAQRTRQLNTLAQGFRASDQFKKRGWSELRLLSKPIARYGEANSKVVDGALYAFVLGTDPEVFLLLEARPAREETEWQYACAPMSVFALKSTYDEKPVWEVTDRMPAEDPARPFFVTHFKP